VGQKVSHAIVLRSNMHQAQSNIQSELDFPTMVKVSRMAGLLGQRGSATWHALKLSYRKTNCIASSPCQATRRSPPHACITTHANNACVTSSKGLIDTWFPHVSFSPLRVIAASVSADHRPLAFHPKAWQTSRPPYSHRPPTRRPRAAIQDCTRWVQRGEHPSR
jgi:hypothetical protein